MITICNTNKHVYTHPQTFTLLFEWKKILERNAKKKKWFLFCLCDGIDTNFLFIYLFSTFLQIITLKAYIYSFIKEN